jgi:hypothetical protein
LADDEFISTMIQPVSPGATEFGASGKVITGIAAVRPTLAEARGWERGSRGEGKRGAEEMENDEG